VKTIIRRPMAKVAPLKKRRCAAAVPPSTCRRHPKQCEKIISSGNFCPHHAPMGERVEMWTDEIETDEETKPHSNEGRGEK
jgi:hypothetical protein